MKKKKDKFSDVFNVVYEVHFKRCYRVKAKSEKEAAEKAGREVFKDHCIGEMSFIKIRHISRFGEKGNDY